MDEQLEIEQKFDVDEGFERPDFSALGAVMTAVHQLSATYFDTADGRLDAARITLRRRAGGTDAGWHLKLPKGFAAGGGPLSRLEVRAPLGAGDDRVPAELAARVAEVTAGLPLTPVAILDTERTAVTVTAVGGAVLAEIADDVVTARRLTGGGQPGGPVVWREVEVEVPAADPAFQRVAAALLLAAGARPGGHGSKLERALHG